MDFKKPNKKTFVLIGGALLIAGLIVIVIVLANNSQRIYTDKAEITAAQIDLSAKAGGTLEELFVKVGDEVTANEVVARIGDELIKTDSDGVVVSVKNDIGKNFQPGESVVSLINPNDLRVVAHLDEDKGLKDVKVGQRTVFTVDAFGSRQYVGTVDEISEASDASSVVFSISDQRVVKQFDIKIRFNYNDYLELKNGMSAKVWIYKQ